MRLCRITLILLMLTVLVGCATAAPPATTLLPDPSVGTAAVAVAPAAPAPGQTPLQALADAIGKLGENKLLSAVNKDAADTLLWVNSQTQLTPLQKFRASQCPTAVQLATADLQAKIKMFQGLLASLDSQAQGAAGADPELILFFTKLRYGPAGQPGSDPKAMLAQVKQDVTERVTAVVDSCRAIIPVKQINEVLRLAGKAGLTVGTGGAGIPLLGF